MPALFRRLDGRNGRIEIPDLGAPIGNLASWTLTRRADKGVESDFYDLHAVCTFIQKALFEDPRYTKRILIFAGKGRVKQLVPIEGPGQRTVLSGRSLVIERVAIRNVPSEGDQPDPGGSADS